MIVRKEQKLDPEIDLTPEEYISSGSIRNDYRFTYTKDFLVRCGYDFLKHLNIGDEILLIHEDTTNLHPFVISLELDEDDYARRVLEVTRKIYTSEGLDVYIIPTTIENELNDDM